MIKNEKNIIRFQYMNLNLFPIIMIIVLLFTTISLTLQSHLISSSNYSLFKAASFAPILLHNHLQQATYLANLLQSNLNISIFVGKLGSNTKAQEDFSIKRYPYFGISLKYNNETILYGMPDIVTEESMRQLVGKLQSYLSRTASETGFYPFLVEIDEKKLDIPEEYLFYSFYLNPHFYHINFVPTEIEGRQNIRIVSTNFQKYYTVHTDTQLKDLMNSLVLQSIPEFSQPIYNSLSTKSQKFNIFMLILDSFNPDKRQSSMQLKEQLTKIGKKYSSQQTFIFWIESKFNLQKQVFLGFSEEDKPPLFALFDPSSRKKQFIPPKTVINSQVIDKFVKQILHKHQNEEKYEEVKGKLEKRGIPTTLTKGENYLILISEFYNEYQIQTGEGMVDRINRFLFNETISLAIPRTYSFEGKELKQGLIIKYFEKEVLISEDEKDCREVEEKIGRILDLPQDWCIEESKMRQYLLGKQDI